MRNATVFALLAGTVLVVLALVNSWPLLLWRLPGGLPLGNALVALALCAPAAAALLLSPPGTLGRKLALVALFIAIAWLPVSVLLAGNLNLNFSGDRGHTWEVFTAVTALLAIVAIAWAVAQLAWRRYRGGAA
ncbi:MAG: hypothetical protein PVI87_07675 [Gammaproteobacteria bacterium]|jgi:hypothetical protein